MTRKRIEVHRGSGCRKVELAVDIQAVRRKVVDVVIEDVADAAHVEIAAHVDGSLQVDAERRDSAAEGEVRKGANVGGRGFGCVTGNAG